MNLDPYVTIIITSFCTGIGISLGAFLTNRIFIKHLEKIIKETSEEKNYMCPYLCKNKPPVEIKEEFYEEDKTSFGLR